jgi:aubergine-like protein
MAGVKKQAVEAIRNSFAESTTPISLAFLIAHKHVAIRILEKKGNVSNTGAGTVVTDQIGAKGIAEFYLISHYANQGSASPTRYTIIHHSPSVWKDDELILMTHYQTVQYPNWAGSLRIPACLMLSSRLAEFSRLRFGSGPAAPHLRQYLHYL